MFVRNKVGEIRMGQGSASIGRMSSLIPLPPAGFGKPRVGKSKRATTTKGKFGGNKKVVYEPDSTVVPALSRRRMKTCVSRQQKSASGIFLKFLGKWNNTYWQLR